LKTKVFLTLLTILVSAIFVGIINAQSGTSINGTVTDQTGASVPGATVRLINPATGFNRTATTSENGIYNFPSIPPDTYRIEVEAGSFKKTINSNVQALVDKTTEVNIALEPGDVSAVVNVTSNTIDSVINTQDAAIGNNFVSEQLIQLPTDLRRVADLLSLQPGVTREGYVAGGRSDQANITLDGVDINDQQTGGRTDQFQTSQGTVLRATTESVEEFRITTTNANANQGRSSGAQVSLITKSGTNNFHGSAFYFYRPTAFSANNFFNNAAGRYVATDAAVINGTAKVGEERAPRPSLARDIFGGSIGGPIVKDRAFFFYSYEGQKQQEEFPVVRVVPLASMGMGQLRFTGNLPGEIVCPAANCVPARLLTLSTAQLNQVYSTVGINPAAVAVFAGASSRYAANDTSVGDGVNTGGFRFNAPTTVNENTHIARFDFNLTGSQTLFVRGNYQSDLTKGVSAFPDTPATGVWSHPYGYVVGHNWTISNNKVNNFRYGLTRQAFSTQGDSSENAVTFRFIYSPLLFSRTLSRVTPIHNFTDDFTWIKGNHTVQFGGNVRIIRNKRTDLGSAFDSAVTNPSFYAASGRVLDQALTAAGYNVPASQRSIVQNAAAALIGRFSQYSGNFTFDIDGSVLEPGTPTKRNFATEEYDVYGQDIWKPFRNLTLTLGLRYGVSRPVYEQNGFQVVPKERLGDFFDRRAASAAQGVPLNDLIEFELAGPKNGGQGFYSMDWNNLQPRVAAAWTPNFDNKYLKVLFGDEGDSVVRGGFAITNDYFGQQLAVSFDALSSIGFTSSSTISANTYNLTTNPAPRFTGFGQNIRSLPGIPAPVQRFATDATPGCLAGTEECPQRIETSLDGTITTPINYTWNVSYGRQLPKGMYFEASYVGRMARNLLAARDVNTLNNLVDPRSGMDWYTAAGLLVDLRNANAPVSSVQPIPYFENLFPGIAGTFGGGTGNSTQEVYRLLARERVNNSPTGAPLGGFDIADYTFVQLLIDDLGIVPNLFYHPQYAAFSSFSSVAKSNFHGAAFSLRQRLGNSVSYDINYTFSKSMDNASGLQTGDSYGSQFILNPLRPDDNYAVSDFDTRHVVNANFLFQSPVGRGRQFFSDLNPVADVFLGGWQLTGVYRWNSGLPLSVPFDAAQWATNWNAQSAGTRIRNVDAPTVRSTQNLFSNPAEAFASFRNARPGETGERNALRLPGYSALDLGLSKSFTMPWSEDHKLQFRWEVFNVFNYQYFLADNLTRSTFGLPQDPELTPVNNDFGKIFTDIQGQPRRMQFGLRYSF
jgi:hypothetical protein